MGAERDEIEAVYREHFPRFLRIATAIVGDEDRAYDAVQEAFARALRHRRGFSGRGPLEGWLWRTVVNTARSARGARPVLALSPNGRRPAEDESLRALIAELPERQRLALFLHYYADLEYEAIAEAMGITTGTVGATLNAARARLRVRLLEVEQ
jgi:RNA polymerase sigma-70 factor (ECF subfamily)